ncbi:MAG: DUF1456 family protein [Thiotrichaceae bacterium]|nr:DUF1456 family protein [Thiotrichaceae bacterium]PCI15047.1 MAG: hypothetical protein COB71_00465 [Thiotrichales bacterium]
MTNNEIIKKLRIALDLKELDIIEVFKLSGYEIKKSELSGIFRKRENKHFKECSDLVMNHFLNGYIIYKRGPKEANETSTEKMIATEPSTN